MRLHKLYLINCGVFKKTAIDFTADNSPQDLICLSGVNGSGKTTIMDLVFNLFVFINPEVSMRDIPFGKLRPHILTCAEFVQLDTLIDGKLLSIVVGDESNIQKSREYPQAFFIISEKVQSLIRKFENTIVKRPRDKNVDVIDGKLMEALLKDDSLHQNILKENTGIFEELLKKIEGYIHETPSIEFFDVLPFVYFFPASDREIHDIRYSSIPKDDSKYGIVHRYHPKEDDLNKLLVFYEYAYEKEFQKLIAWINRHLLTDKEITQIHRPEFRVVIKTKDGAEHGVESLSSGEKSLLILAAQFYLKAYRNSVIMIDEIDQSLHPEFQEKIMKVIKEIQKDKKCQVIVSSHSKIIWNAFEEKSIIRLTEVVI